MFGRRSLNVAHCFCFQRDLLAFAVHNPLEEVTIGSSSGDQRLYRWASNIRTDLMHIQARHTHMLRSSPWFQVSTYFGTT